MNYIVKIRIVEIINIKYLVQFKEFVKAAKEISLKGIKVVFRPHPSESISKIQEYFSGYEKNPEEFLKKTFEEVEGYDEMVIVKGIRMESHCEHHMVPIIGVAHIAYIPNKRVVGISKLARVLEVFSRRLQTQETMTTQIAETINKVLKPKGVAVVIEAAHQCMTTRGVHKTESTTVTSQMLGAFQKNSKTRIEFMNLISD